MEIDDPDIKTLIDCIQFEEKEEALRYSIGGLSSLKILKREGLAIHPLSIKSRKYGYAEYPEFSFKLIFPADTAKFKPSSAIEIFISGEDPVKGILLSLEGNHGDVRLYSHEFPDWLEDDGVGIKISPDTKTNELMKTALMELPLYKKAYELFKKIHGESNFKEVRQEEITMNALFNASLNDSQRNAVNQILSNGELFILHGPPGTGKTTTVIESIRQLGLLGKKILVAAPSNTAVDHLAKGLIGTSLNFLRVGNNARVSEDIFPYTTEGKMGDSKFLKEIKKMKIRAEELRKMANQYKRRFGREEREQRSLLLNEVKAIRQQIKKELTHHERTLYDKAQVILGTPIGLQDQLIKHSSFDTLFIDEAGQCLEPLAWCLIPMAERTVLCGDHLQLPPTVLSEEALKKGYDRSILEKCYSKAEKVHLLDTQYRMRRSIVAFPNEKFYQGNLKTPDYLLSGTNNFLFFDTAGAGYEEELGDEGLSLINQGEIDVIQKIIENERIPIAELVIISPYSAQVNKILERVNKSIRVSTIDSFQGQEESIVIISLVRSNEDGKIGFLKDYRRMNVAMTRAKEKLIIIGDSSTIGADPFYAELLSYSEEKNAYRSVWQIMY